MLERLSLTLNAQFYRPRNALGDVEVRSILSAAEANRDAARHPLLANHFRVQRALATGERYLASLRVFVSTRPVYFLAEDPAAHEEDLIHAYILLLEFDQHVAIFKKSCGDISRAVDRTLVPVSHRELTATIDDNKAAYQKLSARQMTVADTAIRTRSYEAADLKGTLSPFAAGRSVVRYVRIRERNTVRTINLGTARMVDTAERQAIDDAAKWAAARITVPRGRSDAFISTFARHVLLPEVLRHARPNALLIDASALVERLETDGLVLRFASRRGLIKAVSKRLLQRLILRLERVYDIDEDRRIVGEQARLRVNKSSLTFDSHVLRRIRIRVEGQEITLQRFLIANNLYTITFTQARYVYTAGACFEERGNAAHIPALKAMLKALVPLKHVQSEKGVLRQSSREFDLQSVFGVVEAHHAPDDYLICDDLGIEWADHIALDETEACIAFIHSKHGPPSTSASNLQEVVGQAVKNIGYLMFDEEAFARKLKSTWRKTYSGTQIKRLRHGDGRSIMASAKRILADPRLHRKCILACSFLSRRQVVTELNLLERGAAVRGHVVQLMWILSSFVHTVRDAQAVPVIYCQP